jgi:hypothetical protein
VAVAASISAGDDLHPGIERPPDRQDMMFFEIERTLADMRLRRFAVVVVDQHRRYEENFACRHLVDQVGTLVEIGPVLDRVDPGLDRDFEPDATKRMAHDFSVQRMRLIDQCLQFI